MQMTKAENSNCAKNNALTAQDLYSARAFYHRVLNMAVAAYNRGSDVIRRQLDRDSKSPSDCLIDDLNIHGYNSQERIAMLVSPGDRIVARNDGKRWWLMNRPDNGWEEYGRPQKSLWSMMADYKLLAIGFSEDACGRVLELTAAGNEEGHD